MLITSIIETTLSSKLDDNWRIIHDILSEGHGIKNKIAGSNGCLFIKIYDTEDIVYLKLKIGNLDNTTMTEWLRNEYQRLKETISFPHIGGDEDDK